MTQAERKRASSPWTKHIIGAGFILWFLIPGRFLFAQTENLIIKSRTDWTSGIFELDITAPIEEKANQPTGRYKTEQHILQVFPLVTGQMLQDITVDSSRTIGDLVLKEPQLLPCLEELAGSMIKVFATAGADRKFLTLRHRLLLFPALAALLTRDYPFRETPVETGYTPNGDFTGLVIYAGEPLPVQGKEGERQILKPCLFPKLYSPDLKIIHCAEMTRPDKLKLWGNGAYSRNFDLGAWKERIGSYPLRLMARKVYGVKGTDLILPREGVQKLLSSRHNREVLKEGRVLIILPGETSGPSASSLP